MHHNNLPRIILGLLFGVFLVSCGFLPGRSTMSESDTLALHTQAAQTVAAQITQQAFDQLVAQLTQVAVVPTSTSIPESPQPTATPTEMAPTNTPDTPPSIPAVTAVLISPTATPRPALCDQASFLQDVTIPDGSTLPVGAKFTKTWRLRNIGTCTWTSDYSLVFISGDQMGPSKVLPLDGPVYSGNSLEVSVDLIAPKEKGSYRGYWMLSNAAGQRFGIGVEANKAFWVDIKVHSTNSKYAFDLAGNMCLADWRSSSGSLPCPGSANDEEGSVIMISNPVLENGRHEDEDTIWMRPEVTTNGWISGVFPLYKVEENDHFVAEIGCLENSKGCAVLFTLDYRNSKGAIKNLGEWYEIYDGHVTRLDLDLTSLAGKSVQFILTVSNEGKASKAQAYWLVPSIRQVKPIPTPTLDYLPAVQAARQRLAQDLGLEINAVNVIRVEAVEWSDSCLGVHLPDLVCGPVIIPGFRIDLSAGGRLYEAHTNEDGSVIYWFES